MKLMPSRTKFKYTRKHASKIFRNSKGATTLYENGYYGLKALEGRWVTAAQISSVELALKRSFRKEGENSQFIAFRIFPDKPLTKKPIQTRMGKGKGGSDIIAWAAVVQKNRIILELNKNVNRVQATKAFKTAKSKLGIKCSMIERTEDNKLVEIFL